MYGSYHERRKMVTKEDPGTVDSMWWIWGLNVLSVLLRSENAELLQWYNIGYDNDTEHKWPCSNCHGSNSFHASCAVFSGHWKSSLQCQQVIFAGVTHLRQSFRVFVSGLLKSGLVITLSTVDALARCQGVLVGKIDNSSSSASSQCSGAVTNSVNCPNVYGNGDCIHVLCAAMAHARK